MIASWILRFFRWNNHHHQHDEETTTTEKKADDYNNVVVQQTMLTETEMKMLRGGMAPISTITWFRLFEQQHYGNDDDTSSTHHRDHDYNHDNKQLDSIKYILHQRIRTILKKNPWLMGRIIVVKKKQEDGNNGNRRSWWWRYSYNNHRKQQQAYLQYSNDDDYSSDIQIDQYIKENNILHEIKESLLGSSSIHRHTPISEIAKILTESNILLRAKCDCDQPLWKAIIVPCCNNKKNNSNFFAVILSMSHIAGDGHTFYKLYNALMMSTNNDNDVIMKTTPPELNPQRIETTMEQQQHAMGGIAESRIFQLPGFIFTILKGVFLTKFIAPTWFGKHLRAQTRYFYINNKAIQHAKKDYAVNSNNNNTTTVDDSSAPPLFVSTNDIITSWFFMNSDCQIGRMAINFRNRLEGHTDDHAGNYENAILYRVPSDVSNPVDIRNSLLSTTTTTTTTTTKGPFFKRVKTSNQPPSSIDFYNSKLSLISNWSSFASHDVAADFGRLDDDGKKEEGGGCVVVVQQELHVPLFDVASLLPTTLALCIIFQANPNRLGIMLTATPDRMSKLIGSADTSNNKNNNFLLPVEDSMM